MTDEPDRRLVGAIHAELERQEQEDDRALWLDRLASDGTIQIEGTVDLFLLASAIRKELGNA